MLIPAGGREIPVPVSRISPDLFLEYASPDYRQRTIRNRPEPVRVAVDGIRNLER
jgi:hypothetical protein